MPTRTPRILHLDIDGFLASVEQILDPALRGRPVAVGSGCVASRSYEAKAQGVETAMSMVEAKRRCPELVVRDGDARVVERFRTRVAQVLESFAPVVEVCSLDDMYGDLSGLPDLARADGAVQLAETIRARVRADTELSVAQGIGSSRTVARMATMQAKPGKVFEVPAGGERDFLDPHPVRDLPGVGRRSAELLDRVGVATVADLRRASRELLVSTFGVRGQQLYWRARGFDDGDGHGPHPPRVRATGALGSISRETSFEAQDGVDFLQGILAYLLDRALDELRARGLRARGVAVYLRFVDGVAREVQRRMPQATERSEPLLALAASLAERLLLERRVLVRLVGVRLGLLTPAGRRQGELFAAAREDDRLDRALDRLRARHGFGRVVRGRAAELLGVLPHGAQGFRLRTPSLSK